MRQEIGNFDAKIIKDKFKTIEAGLKIQKGRYQLIGNLK